MANNSAVRKRKTRNNSTNNKGSNKLSKKTKVSKNNQIFKSSKKSSNSKKSGTLSSEDKQKLVESMNEFQTTLVKITKSFENINVILGKIV